MKKTSLDLLLKEYLLTHGSAGKAKLAVKLDKSLPTIERWIRLGVPSPHWAYRLAQACGASEKESRLMAAEVK